CAEVDLQPWHDPANMAGGPWRTAAGGALPRAGLREQVIPALTQVLGPGVTEALGRTADLARADADLLDDLAAQAYQEARSRADHGAEPHIAQHTEAPGREAFDRPGWRRADREGAPQVRPAPAPGPAGSPGTTTDRPDDDAAPAG